MKIRFTILAAILGFLEGLTRNDSLRFLEEPEDAYVVEGEEIILCCVFSAPTPKCYWNKDGRIVEIRDRYEFMGDPKQGNCNIRMKARYLVDSGTWKCGTMATSNTHGLSSKEAKLTVFVSPQDPIIFVNANKMNTDSDLIIDNFDDIPNIICESEKGYPATNLKWNFNGKYAPGELLYNQTDNSTLKSKLILKAYIGSTWHGGKLMCIADHITYGFNQQRMTYINIKFPRNTTNVSATTDSGESILDIGQMEVSDTVTLYCLANGYPTPFYSWEMRTSEELDWELFSESQNVTFHPIRGQFSCLSWEKFDEKNKVRSEHIITIVGKNLLDENKSQAVVYFIAFGLGSFLLLLMVFGAVLIIVQRKRRAINKARQWGPHSKRNKQRDGLNIDHRKQEGIRKNTQLSVNPSEILPKRESNPVYLSPITSKQSLKEQLNLVSDTPPSARATENEEPIYQEILPI